jgi:hypothetical protein
LLKNKRPLSRTRGVVSTTKHPWSMKMNWCVKTTNKSPKNSAAMKTE